MQDGKSRPGRTRFLLVFGAFLAPVIASYFFYYVWPPRGAAINYGELIQPVSLPGDLALTEATGTPVPLAALRGKWLLVYAAPAPCDETCGRQLKLLRKARLLQGRDQDRLQVLWLVSGGSTRPGPVVASPATVRVLYDPQHALTDLLPVRTELARHLYIIDPLGNVIMRYDADADLKRMGKDIARLLRASQIG